MAKTGAFQPSALCPLPSQAGSFSSLLLRETPGCRSATAVAIHRVAVQAGFSDLIRGLNHRSLIPGLRRLVGGPPRRRELRAELRPIRPVHPNGLAVLTAASGNRQEGGGFGQSHGGVIDERPS